MGRVAAQRQKRRGAHKVSVGKPAQKRPLERTSLDGRITLQWMLNGMGVYGLH
jgi:hypothetical protein